MPTSNDVPTNGQTPPTASKEAEPQMVNISLLRSGDLLEAMWHGLNARDMLHNQLGMAKQAGLQDPSLTQDIRFQTEFKQAKQNLIRAIEGCEKIKAEINVRFRSVDEMRFALLSEDATK